MAPVTATSVGMAPQIVDDPKLKALMEKLNSYELHPTEPSPMLDQLVKVLGDSSPWRFEEQVGLRLRHLLMQSSAGVSRFAHLYFFFYFRLICTNGYPH
jgi:hypothetical protein